PAHSDTYTLSLHDALPISTNSSETARRLTLLWGVTAVLADLGPPHELPGRLIGRQLLEGGHVHAGATVVLVHTDADLSAQSANRSEEHTSELQSRSDLVCR